MIDKLNKKFQSKQVLTAAEMNQITSKVDEVVDNANISPTYEDKTEGKVLLKDNEGNVVYPETKAEYIEGFSDLVKDTSMTNILTDKVVLNEGCYIGASGKLNPFTGTSYSSPIFLKRNDEIKISSRLSGGCAVLSKTDKNASFYKMIIEGSNPNNVIDYFFKIEEDGYYSICGYTNGLKLNVGGLQVDIHYIKKRIDFLENNLLSSYSDYPVKKNIDKYITIDGKIANSKYSNYTSPVFLKKGTSIKITSRVGGSSVLAKTEDNGISFKSCYYENRSEPLTDYFFKIEEDGYYSASGAVEGFKFQIFEGVPHQYDIKDELINEGLHFIIDELYGNNKINYDSKKIRTNFYTVSNIDYISCSIKEGFDVKIFQYKKDGTFIGSNVLTKYVSIKLKKECYSVRFVINNQNLENFTIKDAEFHILVKGNNFFSFNKSNYLYSNRIIPISFTFKKVKNGGVNVTEGNFNKPLKLSDKYLISKGIIKLPKNYSPNGDKVRLIIYAHSSANPLPQTSFYNDVMPYIDYLVSEGYAVADCCSWGSEDGNVENFPAQQFWSAPTNFAVYSAFYNYLMDNFNLKKEVFLCGYSQGGEQVYSLPDNTCIPVLARCSLSGDEGPLGNIFGYNDRDRFAVLEDFGFSGLENDGIGTSGLDNKVPGHYIGEAKCMYFRMPGDTEWTEERKAYMLKNIDKINGFIAPFIKEISINIKDHFFDFKIKSLKEWETLHPIITNQVPTIFFGDPLDSNLTLDNIKMHKASQNGGNITQIRYINNINKEAENYNPHHSVAEQGIKVDVTTKYGEIVKDVNIAWAEMLDFFRHFE